GAGSCIRLSAGGQVARWDATTPCSWLPGGQTQESDYRLSHSAPVRHLLPREGSGEGDGGADAAGTDRQAGLPGDGLKSLRRLPVLLQDDRRRGEGESPKRLRGSACG